MAKPIRFAPKNSAHGWRINIPAKVSENGKRQQLFYRTQKLALAAADDLKRKLELFGVQTRAISPTLAEQATAAAALLEPLGISLLEAARFMFESRKRDSESSDLETALAAWLLENEGLRDATRRGYRYTSERLSKALSGRLLSTLTAEEILLALAPPGTPQTMAETHIRRGKVFWNFAAEKGWCKAETFARVKAPKNTAPDGEIEILTPAEAEELLRTAEEHFPLAVASYALQLFAGIRVEEVARLESKHVSTEGVELPAKITKKGRRRHITPNATLAAWLERYPFAPCPNWKRTDRACRYMAGFDLVPDPDLVKPSMIDLERDRRPWPQNALRHSHASYAVASGASIDALLFEFGHTGKPTVLKSHYVGRASKRDALAYYSIAPEGVEIARLEVAR